MLGLKFQRPAETARQRRRPFLANAVDLDKLVACLRAQTAQAAQGLVGEDHVRRHLQLGRDLLAQGTQTLEQLGIVANARALLQLGLLTQQIDGGGLVRVKAVALGRATLNGKGKRLVLDLAGTRTQTHDRYCPARSPITAAAQLPMIVLNAPD